MNTKIIKQLYKKEMLDVLRDKKTVLMMVVVPLIIYPLIMMLTVQIMAGVTQEMAKSTYRVGIKGELSQEQSEALRSTDEDDYVIRIVESYDLDKDLQDEILDLYIEVNKVEGQEVFYITYLSASTKSNYGVDIIYEKIKKYSSGKTEAMLVEAGLSPEEILSPVSIEYLDKSTKEESTGSMLGSMLPFMLVVSLLMGTMYPAIDATSGEKERGTLETLLTLPISNKELIFSKFLAVGTFGVVSAILNILAMCGVGAYLLNMINTMGGVGFEEIQLSKFALPLAIGILCVLAFAVFISALSMCVCAFAKSYKEANNYITPVMLVVMLASFVAFIPNIELTKNMALVPVANICLLLRDLLVFKYDYLAIMLVLVSNVIYGILSVLFLSKIYNSESIMFGDGGSGLQLFERRSNMKKGGVATVGDAWFVVIFMALIYLYVGSTLQMKYEMGGLVASQLLFVIVPLLVALYSKKSIVETFRLKACNIGSVVGGMFMLVGAVLVGLLLTVITSSIFKASGENAVEGMEAFIGDSFLVTLLVVALTPAICEELFFRGYVFTAMENKYKYVNAILISSAIFGVYHMSVVKFFTTAFLGMVICYVAHKSGSIFPGMLMHFTNNALSCVTLYYPEKVAEICPLIDDTLLAYELIIFVVVGAVLLIAGKYIVDKTTRNKKAKIIKNG